MCLAVPARVIEIDGSRAVVDVMGNRLKADLRLVDARPGQYVLLHAGIAIEVLDEDEAKATLEAYRQVMGDA